MPPRLSLAPVRPSLALRPRVSQASRNSLRQWPVPLAVSRSYVDSARLHPNPDVEATTDPAGQTAAAKKQAGDAEVDPRAEAAPHVSEEAAAMAKSMGQSAPEVDQGTPVGEAIKGDKDFQKGLPKVMQDALKKQQQQQQKRKFSTSARRLASEAQQLTQSAPEGEMSLRELESPQHFEINEATARAIAEGRLPDPVVARQQAELRARPGLKFDAPTLPLPKGSNMREDRYDDIVAQVTNLMMRDGKKAQAQKHMAEVLTHLRTAPAPRTNNTRPLLPNSPQTHQLPLNPVAYLATAIDSIAPLMRLTSLAGAAGGGASLPIPKPLQLRQRRRTAIKWLLEASERRKGGLSSFPKRFAEEVISVIEGKSAAWEKRASVHRLGIAARSNLTVAARRKR